jgi:hypothetical protein
LFSSSENSLLQQFRDGKDITPIIQKEIQSKQKVISGMDKLSNFADMSSHNN